MNARITKSRHVPSATAVLRNRQAEIRNPQGVHPPWRAIRNCHRCEGQILAIVLLAITLLVGLVFYVYNVGDLVNRRLSMQNAADSAAISGGTWMARSMNIIASDNVNQARMIGMVPVMDSLPLAAQISFHETDDWIGDLGTRANRSAPSGLTLEIQTVGNLVAGSGGNGQPSYASQEFSQLLTELTQLDAAFVKERAILDPFDLQFNGNASNAPTFNMQGVTWWNGRGVGQGSIWQAAAALDDFSQATADAGGLLAQSDAVRFGQANHADAAFMAPIAPVIPAKRGQFTDFQPVLEGVERVDGASVVVQALPSNGRAGPGGAIPDAAFPQRLGPWARLFPRPGNDSGPFAIGWRVATIGSATAWTFVPGQPGPNVRAGAAGAINIGGRASGGGIMQQGTQTAGHEVATQWELNGYTTYGPYNWAMGQVSGYWWANLPDTFFYNYMLTQATAKLGYMFGPANPTLVTMHYPQWVTDYTTARATANTPGTRVTWTMFHELQIASQYPEGDAKYLSAGTFKTNPGRPLVVWCGGWVDPGNFPGLVAGTNDIWKDQSTYQTTGDPTLGIQTKLDANGQPIWQTVYVYTWYVFAGIDVGGNVDITNPCNWNAGDPVPVPTLLDTSIGEYNANSDAGDRRDHFTCLGIAKKNDGATVWPQKFASLSPINSMISMAQVKVFNNASWDLWTQDWRAQLTPVTQWDNWYSQLQAGQADVGSTAGKVNANDVATVMTFMKNLESGSADAPDAVLVH